jgi:hypothetical protein
MSGATAMSTAAPEATATAMAASTTVTAPSRVGRRQIQRIGDTYRGERKDAQQSK